MDRRGFIGSLAALPFALGLSSDAVSDTEAAEKIEGRSVSSENVRLIDSTIKVEVLKNTYQLRVNMLPKTIAIKGKISNNGYETIVPYSTPIRPHDKMIETIKNGSERDRDYMFEYEKFISPVFEISSYMEDPKYIVYVHSERDVTVCFNFTIAPGSMIFFGSQDIGWIENSERRSAMIR